MSARERALQAEIEALKAELSQLRAREPELAKEPGLVPTGGMTDPYRALLSSLGNVFPIGIFRIRPDGSLLSVDTMLQQIFGMSEKEFTNFGWIARVHPDDVDSVKAHWSQGVSKGFGTSLEFRLLRNEGSESIHVVARNIPEFDNQGNLIGHLGFVQDITQLRNLEAEARLSEELNRQIIASSTDCTKVLDLNGCVQQMTEQGCRLVEVDDFEQVRGSDWTSWWPEGGQQVARNALETAKSTGQARFVAFGNTFKGTPKWWDTVVSPIKDADGQPAMLLAVSRDITEAHEQQKHIQHLNAELEQRVKERTEELASANKRLETALSNANSLYNQAPCGYHSVDSQGVFQLVNQTELDWLGRSRESVVGKLHLTDVFEAENPQILQQRFEQLLDTGRMEPLEVDLIHVSGNRRHVLTTSVAVRDEQGRFLRSNSTVVDITQRKQAELALRENQRFLQTVTAHMPGMIAYLDAMLRCRFANEEHRRYYGINPTDMIGLHFSESLPLPIWEEIQPRLQGALDGIPQHYEAWRTKVDGQPFYVSGSFLPDIVNGLVQGVIVQIVDITERKRVEERVNQLNDELEVRIRERSMELLESEQRFRLMADNLRDYSIFFLDDQGRVTDWPDSAQRMEGYTPSEMLGQHYARLLEQDNPDNAIQVGEQTLRMAASRGQHELHNWQTRKDGSRYWVHSLVIALRDDEGELRGFAKISRDMTDAKRLDDLMRNINDELENRVVERTEQLTAANKDLESFSYSVSHDLRSPLRHISSFVSLLDEHLADKNDETTQRYLNTIGNSARHMSQLIDGLLAFSRLGRSAINVMPVDFGLLVEAVVSQIAHDPEGRVVDWVIAPDLPVVQGDAL
ncbi:MAG: PAS domain S-box protein, partial [Hydrogenophaga sp.]|nr:PAS domain S-box protein [Hydrogenophaga sp.]